MRANKCSVVDIFNGEIALQIPSTLAAYSNEQLTDMLVAFINDLTFIDK
jgi:hypothetical protein